MTDRASWKDIKKPGSEVAQRADEDEARISQFGRLVYRLRTEARLTLAVAVGQELVVGVGGTSEREPFDRQTGERRSRCGAQGRVEQWRS